MSSCSEIISENNIVYSGYQYFIVVGKEEENLLMCPFVRDGQPSHRHDLELAWFEFSGTGLPHVDMRVRAIPCRRRANRVQFVGTADVRLTARVKKALRVEMMARLQEDRSSALLSMRSVNDRGRHRPAIRAIYF